MAGHNLVRDEALVLVVLPFRDLLGDGDFALVDDELVSLAEKQPKRGLCALAGAHEDADNVAGLMSFPGPTRRRPDPRTCWTLLAVNSSSVTPV